MSKFCISFPNIYAEIFAAGLIDDIVLCKQSHKIEKNHVIYILNNPDISAELRNSVLRNWWSKTNYTVQIDEHRQEVMRCLFDTLTTHCTICSIDLNGINVTAEDVCIYPFNVKYPLLTPVIEHTAVVLDVDTTSGTFL